ncbi:UNVERIFIED_CONTAM: hypothetical protein HDU68_012699 [Siphonaria sp. JEL0065]|nr:hypothetical protein HDU68_012699 [Siphonaria sp. JEL0065]
MERLKQSYFRHWKKKTLQDVFVQWNLEKKSLGGKNKEEKSKKEVLEEEEAKKKEEALNHGFTALALNPEEAEPKLVVKSGNENIVFQWFYHVFVKGRLWKQLDVL